MNSEFPIKDWKKVPGQMSREEQEVVSSFNSFVLMGQMAQNAINSFFNTKILPKNKIDPKGVKVDYNSATGVFNAYIPRNK